MYPKHPLSGFSIRRIITTPGVYFTSVHVRSPPCQGTAYASSEFKLSNQSAKPYVSRACALIIAISGPFWANAYFFHSAACTLCGANVYFSGGWCSGSNATEPSERTGKM